VTRPSIGQFVSTASFESENPKIAKDLKLLPDFIPDVAVVGVKSFQLAGEMG